MYLSLLSDESSSRYYIGLAFSLALQLNTTLLDACTQITELVQVSGSDTQAQCKDMNREESSSKDNSSTQQVPNPRGGLMNAVTELTSKEMAASNDQVLLQHDDKKEKSELEPSQLPQGQFSLSPASPDSCCSPEGGSLLPDASVELLYALDVLSIILPSVRVWLDWMTTQKELWMCCAFKNIESSFL